MVNVTVTVGGEACDARMTPGILWIADIPFARDGEDGEWIGDLQTNAPNNRFWTPFDPNSVEFVNRWVDPHGHLDSILFKLRDLVVTTSGGKSVQWSV